MTDVDERTEQARSLQTKAKLLAATLSTIHDVGWASASSARIADAAGVSRGAQTHHYPTKTDLLIAAMEEANRRQDERVRKGLTNLVDAEDPVEAYLRLIWTHCVIRATAPAGSRPWSQRGPTTTSEQPWRASTPTSSSSSATQRRRWPTAPATPTQSVRPISFASPSTP